jgi:DNA-binding MarR family transcriptional regulator
MYLGVMTRKPSADAAIEHALVTIRRRQSRRVLARRAQAVGATATTVAVTEVLDLVEEAAGAQRTITVTEVGQRLGTDQPRASKLVAEAVAAGLLTRVADQRDGRRSLIELTPGGQAYLEQVHTFRRAQFAEATADWSARDKTTFADLLTRFVAGLPET